MKRCDNIGNKRQNINNIIYNKDIIKQITSIMKIKQLQNRIMDMLSLKKEFNIHKSQDRI